MKTLLIGPHLFGFESAVARVLRLYLQGLVALRASPSDIRYVVLFDNKASGANSDNLQTHMPEGQECGGNKWRFLLSTLRSGWRTDEVICGHVEHLPIAWALRLLRPRLRYYLLAQGTEVWRPYGLLERMALRGATRILCASEFTRRQMLRFLPSLEAARLVVVPGGLSPEFAPALSDRNIKRPVTSPRLLAVSRLTMTKDYKGIDTLIEAMVEIRKEFPEAVLRIVGDGDDLPRLYDLAARLGLGSAINFCGFVDDDRLRDEYEACDIFTLPSRKEGLGLSYLEAMSFGKPCLAARAGGAIEVVTDEVGTLVEYGNTDQIALAIADLIQHPRDPALILKWARRFSFSTFKSRLADCLRESSGPLAGRRNPRILVYRLGSMGDTLVALPTLRSLRRWFPTAHITWLTNLPINLKARASADLLSGTGLVDEYISYPMGVRSATALRQLHERLRGQRFDCLINLAAPRGKWKSLRDTVFFYSCGLRRIVGTPLRRQDLDCLPMAGTALCESEASQLSRRLRQIGIVDLTDRSLWSVGLRPDEMDYVGSLLHEAGMREEYIVISIGTKLQVNDWTQPNWLELINHLSRRYPNLGLITIGAPDEHDRSAECVRHWGGPHANFAGMLTARQSAAVLRGARLFVGHDSGPMHLAASVNTPCVAIFAARNKPGRWYPAGAGHRIIYHQTECFGCGLETCIEHKKKCILSITVDEVLGHIVAALSEADSRHSVLEDPATSININ